MAMEAANRVANIIMRKNFWKDDNLIKEAVALFQKKDYNGALEKMRAADPDDEITVETVSEDLGACVDFMAKRMRQLKFPEADIARFEGVDLQNITSQKNRELFSSTFFFKQNALFKDYLF